MRANQKLDIIPYGGCEALPVDRTSRSLLWGALTIAKPENGHGRPESPLRRLCIDARQMA